MDKKTEELQVEDPVLIIESLKSMISTPGWSILLKIFKDQMSSLEEQILEDCVDNSLIYTKFDKLKIERMKLKSIIEMPEAIINELSINDNKNEDNLDPYD